MNIGERIYNRRVMLGWSQKRLAELAEVSQAYISRVEAGEINPGVKTLARIAKALRVTAGYLMKE